MLTINSLGNYKFIPSSATYSSGALALPGYRMVRATFFRPQPLASAFAHMQSHLALVGRPMQAVAGIELRSPKPFTFEGFGGFNKTYVSLLSQYGLQLDGKAPAARSNLAPEPLTIAPSEVCIYAFTYTVAESSSQPRQQFVMAGSGELKGSKREDIVRLGDTSPEGMREKAKFCMDDLADNMRKFELGWQHCTAVNVYTVHGMDALVRDEIIAPLGETAIHGFHWHYTRPPIADIEFEVDARGVSEEIVL